MKLIPQHRKDDCVRACIASILEDDGIAAAPADGELWWAAYASDLDRHGLALLEGPSHIVKLGQDVRWIALVPSLHDQVGHAVVMRGHELEWDPGSRRPRYRSGEQVMAVVSGSVLLAPLARDS